MEDLLVVGNGMAGIACLEQILKHSKKFRVTVFGDETHANYNRILLSSVLAGERTAGEITLNPLEWYQSNGITLRLGVRIADIDPAKRLAIGDDGSATPYNKILLATGSQAFLPPISGLDKENVFTFRNLDDTRGILAAARPNAKAVVIGGGLLGLEAARGLQVQGCEVTVVHLLETLMNVQLDMTGGEYLQQKMEQLGVRVLTSRVTRRLLGEGTVEGIEFANGELLEADLVVIAAGIRPNADLGRKAGVTVNRGIVVNDYMETSDPRVFAVGECVEHRGQVYGLVAPLLEQGKVLAATITGNKGPTFEGWRPAAKLKVMGVDVFSVGEFQESEDSHAVRYEDPAMGVYKKLIIRDNRLAGVVLVGDAVDSGRYMEWLR